MTTHPRGDVSLTILERDYVLKPTFSTIAAIQSGTKLGLGELVDCLGLQNRGALRIDIVAAVIFHAVHANNKSDLTLDQIGEAVVDTLSVKDQPLITATAAFLLTYFGKKKQPAEKKPPKPRAPAAG